MTLAGWLAAAAVGGLAGGLSGLIGIGGGAIMVPFLYFFFAHPGLFGVQVVPGDQAVVAHATSLFAIVPISLRGVWLYRRAGLVDWSTVWRIGLPSAVAALLGARLAVDLSAEFLKAAFGCFLLFAAVRLLIPREGEPAMERDAALFSAFTGRAMLGGLAVGLLSALLGVGGGVVAIPILIHLIRTPMRRVAATSLAIIACTATAGVLSYIGSGWWKTGSIHGSLTYVQVWAGVALTVGALAAVGLGTRIQQRLPTRSLRWVFAAVFLILGGRITVVNLLRLLSG